MAHPDTTYLVKIYAVMDEELGVDESDARERLVGRLYDVVRLALLNERRRVPDQSECPDK